MVYVNCFYCNKKTYQYTCKCKHFICLKCRDHYNCKPFCLDLTEQEIKYFSYTDSWVIKYQENLSDFLMTHYNFDSSKLSDQIKLKSIPKFIEIYLNTLKKLSQNK